MEASNPPRGVDLRDVAAPSAAACSAASRAMPVIPRGTSDRASVSEPRALRVAFSNKLTNSLSADGNLFRLQKPLVTA